LIQREIAVHQSACEQLEAALKLLPSDHSVLVGGAALYQQVTNPILTLTPNHITNLNPNPNPNPNPSPDPIANSNHNPNPNPNPPTPPPW
jgi:hypothetical protein